MRTEDWSDDDDDMFQSDMNRWDDDEIPEEEREALELNELLTRQLSREIVSLDNRDLVCFVSEELEALGFEESSDLVLVGLDFDGQYVLELYNVREDSTLRTETGAGNVFMLVNGWVLKTLSDLCVDQMYGEIADLSPSDMTDVWLNLLDDVLEWREEHGLGSTGSRSPEDRDTPMPGGSGCSSTGD
jgi:hypothetical protein